MKCIRRTHASLKKQFPSKCCTSSENKCWAVVSGGENCLQPSRISVIASRQPDHVGPDRAASRPPLPSIHRFSSSPAHQLTVLLRWCNTRSRLVCVCPACVPAALLPLVCVVPNQHVASSVFVWCVKHCALTQLYYRHQNTPQVAQNCFIVTTVITS